MAVFPVVVAVLLVLGIGLFVTALVRGAVLTARSRHWPTTTGTVVDLRAVPTSAANLAASRGAGLPAGSIRQRSTRYRTTVEYQSPDGVTHRTSGRSIGSRLAAQAVVGSTVTVAYDPDAPDRAVVRP